MTEQNDLVMQALMDLKEGQGQFSSTLQNILLQTTKTNGRVTECERRLNLWDNNKARIAGAITAIMACGTAVGTVIGFTAHLILTLIK